MITESVKAIRNTKGQGEVGMKKQVYNPYLPSYEYIPDGEPRVFGDRLYIYGSHDKFGGSYYCENDYVCWSAPLSNLSDWKYEGVIFRYTDHPQDAVHRKAEKNGRYYLFAPDVIRGRDERFYLYYSIADSSIISVAVCDTPAGQYGYLGDVCYPDGRILGESAGEYFQFDPSIFIDDNGRIYLYSGFCPTNRTVDVFGRKFVGCHMYELEQDMLTVQKGPMLVIPREAKVPAGAVYFEAPSMRKINGIYYLVYSARNTGLYYFYSDRPDGDFCFGGRIHSTSDVGINGYSEEEPCCSMGNTHGGLVELNGRYYIFDHRHTNNSSFCRQGVAEPVTIDKQGRIVQVETTSCGLNGGWLIGEGSYPAYIACVLYYEKTVSPEQRTACITQDGDDRETLPGQYIRGISNGCIVGYRYFEGNGLVGIRIRIRGKASGTLYVTCHEEGGKIMNPEQNKVGKAEIRLCTDEWQQLEIPVQVSEKIYPLYLRFHGDGGFDLSEITLIAP